MAMTKWQCTQCGTTQSTSNGLRPSPGNFCSKSKDRCHKWVKVINKPTKWQCTKCGCTQSSSTGLRPSVGSVCSKSSDRKHKWVKV